MTMTMMKMQRNARIAMNLFSLRERDPDALERCPRFVASAERSEPR
jgi:hypothetical protein